MNHYSEWKRGDVLRVIDADPADPARLGELVTHDDQEGDDTPYCTTKYGRRWAYSALRQLEFVSRPRVKK